MDYETLNETKKDEQKKSDTQEMSYNRDDFSSMCIDLLKKVNFKVAIFIFIIGIFIFSDVFIDNILLSFGDDTVYGSNPTTKGTIIQLSFLTISYIIFDLLIQGEIL